MCNSKTNMQYRGFYVCSPPEYSVLRLILTRNEFHQSQAWDCLEKHVKRASLDVKRTASNSRIKSFYWGNVHVKGSFKWQTTRAIIAIIVHFQWKNNHALNVKIFFLKASGHWNPRWLLSNPDVFRKCARRWPWIGDFYGFGDKKFRTVSCWQNLRNHSSLGCPTKK